MEITMKLVRLYTIRENGEANLIKFVDTDHESNIVKCGNCDASFQWGSAKHRVIIVCKCCNVTALKYCCPVCGGLVRKIRK